MRLLLYVLSKEATRMLWSASSAGELTSTRLFGLTTLDYALLEDQEEITKLIEAHGGGYENL